MIETINGIEIPEEVLGVLYICKYTRPTSEKVASIEVVETRFYKNRYQALEAYASTRNPESQVAFGHTRESFIKNLNHLHTQMKNQDWLNDLTNYL